MSGWLKKAKDAASDNSEKIADALEENLTDEKVDSVLGKVPGGKNLADKVPDNVNIKAAEAVRENLGKKEPNS